MYIRKIKTLTKLAILGTLPLFLLGAIPAETLPAAPATENAAPLSKEEFAAILTSKLRLLKVRTAQLKAMNACFNQVSGVALEAKKKGEVFSKAKAMELVKAYGLDEASRIDKSLEELQNIPQLKTNVHNLLDLAKKKADKQLESEFTRLEKELLAELKTAKGMGIDVSTFKEDMAEYAKSRFEHLMWVAIFTGQKNAKPKR